MFVKALSKTAFRRPPPGRSIGANTYWVAIARKPLRVRRLWLMVPDGWMGRRWV